MFSCLQKSSHDRRWKPRWGVIMTKLNEYFVPKQISIYERFVFNCYSQKSGENFDQIFTWRRKLAATCQFGTFRDETMRDRIVTGLRDHGHRELQIAINICRTNEMAASQRHKIREQNGAIWHSSPCPRNKTHEHRADPRKNPCKIKRLTCKWKLSSLRQNVNQM